MKRIASALLALLLAAALALGALAEPELPAEEELLSEAVDLTVPEEEELPLGGDDAGDAGYADFIGGTAVSAVDDTPLNSDNFPDDTFRKFVLDHFDKDKNYMLSVAERSIVYSIDVSGLGIRRLGGIEFFPNITSLDCGSNELVSLDVSANAQLEDLECSYNNLESLDISTNVQLNRLNCSNNHLIRLTTGTSSKLHVLYCHRNQLESLDISGLSLSVLYCSENNLTSLDVSKNGELRDLRCSGNQLTSLDVSGLSHLEFLSCSNNPLSRLNIRGCPLSSLDCAYTKLESLDLSGAPGLKSLNCNLNNLTALDVSLNPELTSLECHSNNLTELDVRNNPKLQKIDCNWNQIRRLDLSGNPLLITCAGTTPTYDEDSDTVEFKDDENGSIQIGHNTILVVNGKTVYDGNPGYFITPEQDEYTINLAHGDTVRINCALSFFQDEKNAGAGLSYKSGVSETAECVDMSENPIAFTRKNGKYVGSAFFDVQGLKTGTVNMGIAVYVNGWKSANQYDPHRITIHVIDDAGAAPTSPTPPPSEKPTEEPVPTPEPTPEPTEAPTGKPSEKPAASAKPAESEKPVESPKPVESEKPAESAKPTAAPTHAPGDTVKLKSGSYRLLSDGTVKFMKPADKTAKTAKVPASVTVDGRKMKVSEIAPKAFYRNKALTKVSIGKTVKTVGKSAFCGCANLKTVKGGAGIVTIGAAAFKGCKALTAITLNRSVKSIGKSAFQSCAKLKKVTIKTEKLTKDTVGKAAFKGIYAKAVFKCPKAKLKAYAAMLAKKGAPKAAKYR